MIHKIHHQCSAPFGLATEYASPVEAMMLGFGTVGCSILWCALTGDLHILTMYAWIVPRLFQAIDAHLVRPAMESSPLPTFLGRCRPPRCASRRRVTGRRFEESSRGRRPPRLEQLAARSRSDTRCDHQGTCSVVHQSPFVQVRKRNPRGLEVLFNSLRDPNPF